MDTTNEALNVNGNANPFKAERTMFERLAIVAERERQADYERGRLQAANVMRTLGLDEAKRDALALVGSALASAWYVAGYCDAVRMAEERS